MEEFMRDNYTSYIPGGRIIWLHTHSDTANQHFKSTDTMNYCSFLPPVCVDCEYVYCLGATNQGKGVSDGLGGIWKHYISKLLESCEANCSSLKFVTGGHKANARHESEPLNTWKENVIYLY